MSEHLFADMRERMRGLEARDLALVEAFVRAGRTLDDLPYTEEFERLYAEVGKEWGSRGEVIHRLQNLRKRKQLPRLGAARSETVRVTPEEEEVLRRLVVEAAGTLGQRDQLVYDARFDEVVQRFNASTGRNLAAHEAWRLVAKLAK
jgi:hypothetical protein